MLPLAHRTVAARKFRTGPAPRHQKTWLRVDTCADSCSFGFLVPGIELRTLSLPATLHLCPQTPHPGSTGPGPQAQTLYTLGLPQIFADLAVILACLCLDGITSSFSHSSVSVYSHRPLLNITNLCSELPQNTSIYPGGRGLRLCEGGQK